MITGSLLLIIGIALVLILVFALAFMLLRALLFPIGQKDVELLEPLEVDGRSVAERLGLAVQYKTIADADQEQIDGEPFEGLHRLLETLYPQVHKKLKRELINEYSLLYTWKGKNKDLAPVMFISHLDVVPADESEGSDWTHPPFSGELADGFVWGRGTIDVKCGVIGALEAVSTLLKSGYKPERTIYLGFGHDEEVSGRHGAHAIADSLASRGVQLACLLDEGGIVTEGFLAGVDAPVALVGISEKGYLSLKLSVKTEGGHSSMPPEKTAIGLMSSSLAALEAQPFPAHLEIVQFLMAHLGKALPFAQRLVFANTWLFGGILKKRLGKSNSTNALMRTTTAPTIFNAGATENVLPPEAEAVVNFRIMPGDTLRSVYERVLKIVADERVEVKPFKSETLESDYGWNPTPVADAESAQYECLMLKIRETFPEALVAPYLVVGATDARHYAKICRNAFRFLPIILSKEELKGMHGVNERLSFENCARMVGFYTAFMKEMGDLPGDVDGMSQGDEVLQAEDQPDEDETVRVEKK